MKLSKKSLHRIVLFILLIGTVFVDLVNGYYYFTNPIGVIFRTAVALYAAIFFVGYNKSPQYKLYVLIAIFLAGCCNISGATGGNNYSLMSEISQFVKILYPLLLAFYFKYTLDKDYITFETLVKWGVINVLIRSAFILFSTITGIGHTTYGDEDTTYGFGTTSFFNAQNDNSLALLMGYCFCMYRQFSKKETSSIWKVLLLLSGLALIGTRAGLLGGILITFIATTQMVIFGRNSNFMNSGRKIVYSFLILSAIISSSIFVYNEIKDKPFMMDKYIDLFINPPRSSQEIAANEFIQNRSPVAQYLGSGVMEYRLKLYGNLGNANANADSSEGKQSEKDFVDLLGAYGYLLASWIFLFPFACLIILFNNFIKQPSNYLKFALFIAITIFLGHSLIAGHGIKNPTPGTILAIIYVYVLNIKQLKDLG